MGLESGGELFGVIVIAAGHPAGRFHAAGDLGVIGILFVVRPGVPAHHRVDLEQADQEDEPALQLVLRDVPHAVIGIVQVEDLFEPEHAGDLGVVALVAEHVVADGAGRSKAGGVAHVVVGRPHQVAGVALLDELGDRPGGDERDIVGMGLDRQQHLALVRRARGCSFQEDLAAASWAFADRSRSKAVPTSIVVRKSRLCIVVSLFGSWWGRMSSWGETP